MELPKFEGRKPAGTRLKVNGLAGDTTRAMRLGEKVFLLVEAEVVKVSHEEDAKTDTVSRVHTGAMERAMELTDADATWARKLLDADSDARKRAEEEAAGILRLPEGDAPPELTDEAAAAIDRAKKAGEAE